MFWSYFIRYTWEEEIRFGIPDIPVTGIYVLSKTNEHFIDPAVVITSYDLMTKAKDMLLNLKFGIIVFVRFLNLHFNFFLFVLVLLNIIILRMKVTV